MDAPNPMWWLAWELFKYLAAYVVTWLLITVMPGEQPRWLQFALYVLVALVITIVIYRNRVSSSRRIERDV